MKSFAEAFGFAIIISMFGLTLWILLKGSASSIEVREDVATLIRKVEDLDRKIEDLDNKADGIMRHVDNTKKYCILYPSL